MDLNNIKYLSSAGLNVSLREKGVDLNLYYKRTVFSPPVSLREKGVDLNGVWLCQLKAGKHVSLREKGVDLNSNHSYLSPQNLVSLREKGVDLNVFGGSGLFCGWVSLREKGVDLNNYVLIRLTQYHKSPFVRREWI